MESVGGVREYIPGSAPVALLLPGAASVALSASTSANHTHTHSHNTLPPLTDLSQVLQFLVSICRSLAGAGPAHQVGCHGDSISLLLAPPIAGLFILSLFLSSALLS